MFQMPKVCIHHAKANSRESHQEWQSSPQNYTTCTKIIMNIYSNLIKILYTYNLILTNEVLDINNTN